MNYSDFLSALPLGMAGAAAFELLKLYDMRGRISESKFNKIIRSPMFWSIVAGMLAASGFIAWTINDGNPNASAWQVVISGIAARSFIRETVGATVVNRPLKIGTDTNSSFHLRDIF